MMRIKVTKFRVVLFVLVVVVVALSWPDAGFTYPPSYYVMTVEDAVWAGPYYPVTPRELAKCNADAQSMAATNPRVAPDCKLTSRGFFEQFH